MSTDLHLDLLGSIRIASPCPVAWDDMTGDEQTRHCARCDLKVHNLSAMTRGQAEALLAGAQRSGARLCAYMYRRADGTVMTQDCPVGLARVRAAARRMAGRIAAGLALVIGGGVAAAESSRNPWGGAVRLRAVQPFATISSWLMPAAPALGPMARPSGPMVTGGIVCPPPPGPPPPPGAPNGSPGQSTPTIPWWALNP